MENAPALIRYAHALGRWQAAYQFASSEMRRVVALAQISAAWKTFRRDAGPGEVGPAHQETSGNTGITRTCDSRRDGMLLWLADHARPALAEAAATIARAVGATRRFGADECTLLDAASDALTAPPSRAGPVARALLADIGADDPMLDGLALSASAVDRLRSDPAFQEGSGEQTRHVLPGGAVSQFVPAPPGAAWALNLVMLKAGMPSFTILPCPGLVSRQLFRDLEPEELAGTLVEHAAAAFEAAYRLIERIDAEVVRGRDALARMSRNSRTREAWALVVSLDGTSRAQLARALGLSRAGADIQAHAMAEVGLVTLGPAGRIEWACHQPEAEILDKAAADEAPSSVFAAFDANMAEIDRLLAERSDLVSGGLPRLRLDRTHAGGKAVSHPDPPWRARPLGKHDPDKAPRRCLTSEGDG